MDVTSTKAKRNSEYDKIIKQLQRILDPKNKFSIKTKQDE